MSQLTHEQVTQLPADTIEQLKATPICGNAFHDNHIFQKVDKFFMNEANSISDRAESIRWMTDKVMGMGRCEEVNDIDLINEEISFR